MNTLTMFFAYNTEPCIMLQPTGKTRAVPIFARTIQQGDSAPQVLNVRKRWRAHVW